MTKEKVKEILAKHNKIFQEFHSKYPDSATRDPDDVLAEMFNEELVKELNKEKEAKFLIVEDGSVDVEALEEDLKFQNIKVIVCRQGATPPKFLEV